MKYCIEYGVDDLFGGIDRVVFWEAEADAEMAEGESRKFYSQMYRNKYGIFDDIHHLIDVIRARKRLRRGDSFTLYDVDHLSHRRRFLNVKRLEA